MASFMTRHILQFSRLYVRFLPHNILKYSRNEVVNNVSLQTDALDDFTEQLLQKKTDKWEMKKALLQKKSHETCDIITLRKMRHKPEDINIQFLDIEKVNKLFLNAVEESDNTTMLKLIDQCIEHKKCPTLSVLITILSVCSHAGDKPAVEKIIRELCSNEINQQVLEENSHFRHYLAEAIWIKGNITKSLEIFEIVYRENAYLRRRIRLMLRYLITDVVANHSEAALVNVIKFSEGVLHDFSDFYPVTCVWQACFLSEWFSNQTTALELLERNDGLCKSVVNRIPYVVAVSLRCHRTEVVYRLLEVLLKYNMKHQYTIVLHSLLDYQFLRGDLRRALEIIQWSIRNNVDLPPIQQEKFVNLLLENNVVLPKRKPESSTDWKSNKNVYVF